MFLTAFIWTILSLFIPRESDNRIRKPVDTVGFATMPWQMDSVMARIQRMYGGRIATLQEQAGIEETTRWKCVISPHDDYAYAGWLYPAILQNMKAPTVILIGVAHKAGKFKIGDRMVFGTDDAWQSPYGPVGISSLQYDLTDSLPLSTYIFHDSLIRAEHSLEAIVPFLQYYNRKVEIIPILIPFMAFNTMEMISGSLSACLEQMIKKHNLDWGRDIAVVISSDAVHYGCEDWGGQDYAAFGCDTNGYRLALQHEHEIMGECLTGTLSKKKLEEFNRYTVQDTNYRTYRWTWCGRYSVPFGLLTVLNLNALSDGDPVKGVLVDYATSISHPPLHVTDLKMGTTAPAKLKHWVGYAAIGYK